MPPIMPKDFDPRWFAAPFTQYQLPVFSGVGKGLRGDTTYLTIDDTDPSGGALVCMYRNEMTRSESELWRIPLLELCPKMHYKVWKGVREVDGINMWVTWNEFSCSYEINNVETEIWAFCTPYSMTVPYNGGLPIPTDYIVESNETE